jgi:hypothetical protein
VKPAFFLVAGAVCTSCGYFGTPLPPTLDIPIRITDLVVAQRGDKVVAQFTLPSITTEGKPLKSVRSVDFRAGELINPWDEKVWAASAKHYDVPETAPGVVRKEIPAAEWVGKTVIFAVRAAGPKGKVSDWSTMKNLPIEKPLPTPTDFKAQDVPQGVGLTWQGMGPHYRIFRAVGDEEPKQLGETDDRNYLDSPTEYGTRYRYWVIAHSGELLQSDSAGPAEITPKDVFPPAVPAGLTGEPGVGSIELSWERNTESDFKGYNVFRSVEGGGFEKVAPLIAAPTYSDHQVEAGKKYRYQISAVDVSGNESERSAAVEVTAQ